MFNVYFSTKSLYNKSFFREGFACDNFVKNQLDYKYDQEV